VLSCAPAEAQNGAVPPDDDLPDNARWQLADRIAEALRARHSADILAIGVYGSMAHGDDTDSSDIDLLVVTYRRGAGPRPVLRRVDGILVDLSVAAADDHLRQARTLAMSWPLTADRYVTTRPLYDQKAWFKALRDAHLGRLAEARPAEFSALAREAWCRAAAAHDRAVRLAEWYDTDAALLLLGEARLHAAMVIGLLSRTYFRNSADAVRRTGTAGADMVELGALLKRQAGDLTGRGQPVDGPLSSLLG
jgi:predicted nucleotidyltransferase